MGRGSEKMKVKSENLNEEDAIFPEYERLIVFVGDLLALRVRNETLPCNASCGISAPSGRYLLSKVTGKAKATS